MFTLEDLSRAIAAYEDEQSSLDQFEDWFRDVSRQKFAQSREVLLAIREIDSAFSRLHYEGIPEAEFAKELANAVRPFALVGEAHLVVETKRSFVMAAAAVIALAVVPAHVDVLRRFDVRICPPACDRCETGELGTPFWAVRARPGDSRVSSVSWDS